MVQIWLNLWCKGHVILKLSKTGFFYKFKNLRLSRLLSTGFKAKLITDREIVDFFTKTGASQGVKYDSSRRLYSCNFERIENYVLHSGMLISIQEFIFYILNYFAVKNH